MKQTFKKSLLLLLTLLLMSSLSMQHAFAFTDVSFTALSITYHNGEVYAAGTGTPKGIIKIADNGTPSSIVTDTPYNSLASFDFDSSGNLYYILDNLSGTVHDIYKISNSNLTSGAFSVSGNPSQVTTLLTGSSTPSTGQLYGLAIQPQTGDLYFGGYNTKKIYKILSSDLSGSTLSITDTTKVHEVLGTWTSIVGDLAFDSLGNLYFNDFGSTKINKVLAADLSDNNTIDTPTVFLTLTGVALYGITFNSQDRLYYSNLSKLRLYDAAPVASNVSITGTAWIGNTLTGSYSYSDMESDAEGATAFKWYRADDSTGTNKAAIPSATSQSYTITQSDNGKFIGFSVKPASTNGTVGTEAFSAYKAPVLLSSNAELSSLTLSSGPLSTTFDKLTTSYTSSVANSVSTLTVTAVVYDANSTMAMRVYDSSNQLLSGYPVSLTSAAASSAIPLSVGSSRIEVTVTAQDGTTTKMYTVNVTRAAGAASTVTYNGNSHTGGSVPIDIGTYEQGVAVSVYGNTGGLSKTGYTFAGWNTAADGTGTSYAAASTFNMGSANVELYAQWIQGTLTNIAELSQLTLSEVTLDPVFAKSTTAYAAIVPNFMNTTTVTASVYDSSGLALLQINGTTVASGQASAPISLNVGQNTIQVEVTAPDGVTKKLYTVTVSRLRSNSSSPSTSTTASPDSNTGFRVFVNGQPQDQIATGTASTIDGQTVMTAKVDKVKLEEQLAKEGNGATVVIPVTANVGKVSALLTGDAVKLMENKQAVLVIQTVNGNYELPASELLIDRLSNLLGEQVKLSDIVVQVDIGKSDAAKVTLMQNLGEEGGYSVVVAPVDFTVTASYNGKTVTIDKFSSYVLREIPLPDGVDASKITTAIVLEPDGTVRHVPTYVTVRDGRSFAVINSLTNSTYSVIWHPMTFTDVRGHWSQDIVNEMASRMVVTGADSNHYKPDAAITRAEFAAITVRGLGLADNGKATAFTDVMASEWYVGAVAKAKEYAIIEGYEDGTFRPSQTITRQEAMVMIARAMKLAGLETNVNSAEQESVLAGFADNKSIGGWARQAIAATVKNQLVNGLESGLMPTSNITRAETAAIIQRMLKTAGVIQAK
ncbi:S-layer homology domain-containing protein [Paenibacillus agricola]|uniref:SLH domain-containing protein n=1 Tax=Paenibacillus agricola TaxID=2716264 RepID=A0ABX0JH76_9BACL|nr:S-layer homology domain-containing protein [Paenibacillus agricola]NHN33045.1 hypothetical protein [Paenibacillus agricola]